VDQWTKSGTELDYELRSISDTEGEMEGCVGRGKIGLRPVMRVGWRRR
jgi:hypothetical protein